jgi:hypothetical protein
MTHPPLATNPHNSGLEHKNDHPTHNIHYSINPKKKLKKTHFGLQKERMLSFAIVIVWLWGRLVAI